MNIECKSLIEPKAQHEFYLIDKVVTGLSFSIHNELGRFCSENIYKHALAEKCRDDGLKAETEVPLVLKYRDFEKIYKIDLLVEGGIIYELKVAEALNKFHKQQLINYLILTQISHGKLLNFRTTSLEYEFVSSSVKQKDRFAYSFDTSNWRDLTEKCCEIREILADLLQSLGAYLDFNLYNEVLLHCLGMKNLVKPVNIYIDGKCIGQQKMQLIDSFTALHFSGITGGFKRYEKHVRKLIDHTDVKYVQWINFNKKNINMQTISK